MTSTVPDALTCLAQALKATNAALATTPSNPEHRTEKLADALRSLSRYSFHACLLVDAGQPAFAVVDEHGKSQPALAEQLRGPLLRFLAENDLGDHHVTDMDLIVPAAIRYDDRKYGVLMVGAPSGDEAEARSLLDLIGESIGCALHMEESIGGPEEAARRDWLGYISETTSIVAHEFNNFLNGIMLHLALLKQEAPREMHSELDVMKRLSMEAAALIKRLQQYNGKYRATLVPIDLNRSIEEVLERTPLPAGITAVHRELAPELPQVQGTTRELGRLLDLLLKQAGAAMASNPGPVTIRTERGNRKVLLRFEDGGPSVSAEMLPRLFEPFFQARPGGEEPGLALCHTLARRLHAGLRAENRPEGGLAFILELTPNT